MKWFSYVIGLQAQASQAGDAQYSVQFMRVQMSWSVFISSFPHESITPCMYTCVCVWLIYTVHTCIYVCWRQIKKFMCVRVYHALCKFATREIWLYLNVYVISAHITTQTWQRRELGTSDKLCVSFYICMTEFISITNMHIPVYTKLVSKFTSTEMKMKRVDLEVE